MAEGVAAFHRHLPVEDLLAGRPTVWSLAEPGVTDLFSETGTGIVGFFTHPAKGARKDGTHAHPAVCLWIPSLSASCIRRWGAYTQVHSGGGMGCRFCQASHGHNDAVLAGAGQLAGLKST